MRTNLYRTLRTVALIGLASITAVSSEGQTTSTKKRTTRSSTTKTRARKKVSAKKPTGPPAPDVHYTAPRTVQSLAADLGALAGRVRSGQFGIMVVSLTRGDTLFDFNAGTPLMP